MSNFEFCHFAETVITPVSSPEWEQSPLAVLKRKMKEYWKKGKGGRGGVKPRILNQEWNMAPPNPSFFVAVNVLKLLREKNHSG